ncbi:MAG: type II toxin-antitoxin system HigB family toxin [Cyclobacteriaceae bacterium]|nr:type II toxin-antitoxin system HigB family toxin [Cyclobacteriaceae bacterium]
MNVLAYKTLEKFWMRHADAEVPLKVWYLVCRRASWRNFHELANDFPDAFPVGDDRVVFDIKGNRYRLVVRVVFLYKMMQIKWIGTPAQYNRIDVRKADINI